MNEKKSTEPEATSFQSGKPTKAGASIQVGKPSGANDSGQDWQSKREPSSQLDRFVEAIKSYEYVGLGVGVGVQLLVLFSMIVLGGMKKGNWF